MSRKALVWVLAAIWLALALPHVDTRYSFNWDSSQYERGVERFDIRSHQPHPPGYPLWILALKALTPLTGGANRSQVVLALLFSAAGLLFFGALAGATLGREGGTAAAVCLAFSPLVCLNAMATVNYAVDLFASCAAGYMAWRMWRGEIRWAAPALGLLAVTAGFRPSGVVFLLPLLGAALWRAWRKGPGYAAGAVLAGAALFLAWYIPTALITGGFAALAALNRNQMISSVRQTSVFLGAAPAVHAHMAIDASLYLGLALITLLPAAVRAVWRGRPDWGAAVAAAPGALFIALWLAPNLAMVYLFHCGAPGYVLLSAPPLVLLGNRLLHASGKPVWMAAAAALGLAAGYFPYERLVNPARVTVAYQLLRATPRLPGLLESEQRRLRTWIDALPGQPWEKLIFCMRESTEAPNIRTVTYEYGDGAWADGRGGEMPARLPDAVRSVGWLCGAAGPPPAVRARFPQARRVGGNRLFSFWAAERPR